LPGWVLGWLLCARLIAQVCRSASPSVPPRSEQYPLAQQRLGGVVGQLQPAHPALDALRALERRIEAEQPPLEEAQGELDSTIAALLSGLGGNGLDTASLVSCAFSLAPGCRVPAELLSLPALMHLHSRKFHSRCCRLWPYLCCSRPPLPLPTCERWLAMQSMRPNASQKRRRCRP
jgi:hypothetical protein